MLNRGTTKLKKLRCRFLLNQTPLLVSIGSLLMSSMVAAEEPTSPAATPKERDWFLLWQDEFDGDSINKDNWTHQIFPGIESGNKELQYYTDRPENSYVKDGILTIEARREDYEGHEYTSARLNTAQKFEFTYGRVETRLRLPSTPGAWPAVWLLPTDSVYGTWPLSGEIDLVESVNDADEIYGTIHYGAPHHTHQGTPLKKTVDGKPVDFSKDFHVYALEWDPTEIRWYCDGEFFGKQNDWQTNSAPYPAPFDQRFHLLVNLAIGGNWPGPPNETSVFPQRLEIDYIRVYQSGNRPPELKLISPTAGMVFPSGQAVTFQVEVTDPDSPIAAVRVQEGEKVLAEATTAPYELSVPSIADGCYTWQVVALDDEGLSRRTKVFFKVGEGCPRKPYGTTALTLGTRMEAEHFDSGLEGEAYHDTDSSNNGWVLRPGDGVDLSETPEKDVYVGWTLAGEWLKYSITPPSETQSYFIRTRTSSAERTGRYRVSAGENHLEVDVQPTGDWNKMAISESESFEIPAGTTELTLTILKGNFNLDWLEFVPVK